MKLKQLVFHLKQVDLPNLCILNRNGSNLMKY